MTERTFHDALQGAFLIGAVCSNSLLVRALCILGVFVDAAYLGTRGRAKLIARRERAMEAMRRLHDSLQSIQAKCSCPQCMMDRSRDTKTAQPMTHQQPMARRCSQQARAWMPPSAAAAPPFLGMKMTPRTETLCLILVALSCWFALWGLIVCVDYLMGWK